MFFFLMTNSTNSFCFGAKGYRQQNFFFHSSWKWTESRLPKVRTVSRKQALKTWKSISEFKPIAIPPYSLISSSILGEIYQEQSWAVLEIIQILLFSTWIVNQCPPVLELYARVEGQRRINLFRTLTVPKLLWEKFWKIFQRTSKCALLSWL